MLTFTLPRTGPCLDGLKNPPHFRGRKESHRSSLHKADYERQGQFMNRPYKWKT
jgi:hypothetical protein